MSDTWPPPAFDSEGTAEVLRAEGYADLAAALAARDDDYAVALGYASRGLVRAAERLYVLSTGQPRPKRDLAGWSSLLSSAGLTLGDSEILVLSEGSGAGTVDIRTLAQCMDTLPALLDSGPLDGVEADAFLCRPTPLPEDVIRAAVEALERLQESVPDLTDPCVFGSWARGQERPGSDLDVFALSESVGKGLTVQDGDVSLHVVSRAAWESGYGVAALGARREGLPLPWVPTEDARLTAEANDEGATAMGEDFFKDTDEIRNTRAAAEEMARAASRALRDAAESNHSRLVAAAEEFRRKAVELDLPTGTGKDFWHLGRDLVVRRSDTPALAFVDGRPFTTEAFREMVSKDRYDDAHEIARGLIRGMAMQLEQA